MILENQTKIKSIQFFKIEEIDRNYILLGLQILKEFLVKAIEQVGHLNHTQ